jgi:hypothetical protein
MPIFHYFVFSEYINKSKFGGMMVDLVSMCLHFAMGKKVDFNNQN